MTDYYAVIGHPVHHSKSPQIHQAFARQTGEDLQYSAIEVPLDALESSLKQLCDVMKLKGINVTVPFKEQVFALAEHKSARATLAGAVNTVTFQADGSLLGDNTDGQGLCQDLTVNHRITLTDKRILLLGAGGAARGVIGPLLEFKPETLYIANRTAAKAVHLADIFAALGPVVGGGYEEIQGEFDIIINATAASLSGEVPPINNSVLAASACCYDMMYSVSDTAFIQWAKHHGVARSIDGLGMLVEQAAEAFFVWRDIRPETQTVISALRKT